MKNFLLPFSSLCLAFITPSVHAQATAANASGLAAVSGNVTLVQADSKRPIPTHDASEVVVWLSPVGSVKLTRAAADRKHYRLLQRNKRFEPRLLVIPVGALVDFPNADPWFHNVFSLYRGKKFDLGLYQAGSQRSVRFDRLGPSYLFCNIHPEMTGVVLAVDSDLFATTDKNGRYSIARVPPGKYVLHVWYESATPEALEALQKSVLIENGDQPLAMISVAVKQIQATHKNKYGQDYDPDSLKTDY
jgi:plastocyanin